MNLRRTRPDGERRRPTRKTLLLVAAGAVAFGVALVAPAAGSALGAATAVVTLVSTERKGGKGE